MVSEGKIPRPSGARTTPARDRRTARSRVASRPATYTCPPSGASSPAATRHVVDFPAPLGPRRARISPGCTARSDPVQDGRAVVSGVHGAEFEGGRRSAGEAGAADGTPASATSVGSPLGAPDPPVGLPLGPGTPRPGSRSASRPCRPSRHSLLRTRRPSRQLPPRPCLRSSYPSRSPPHPHPTPHAPTASGAPARTPPRSTRPGRWPVPGPPGRTGSPAGGRTR